MVQPAEVRVCTEALAPEEVERFLETAQHEMRRGEVDRAIEILEELTMRSPDSVVAYTRLGIALDRRRNYLDARAAYCKAIALQPDLAEAHHGLGSTLQAMGRSVEALEHLSRAADLDPQNASIQNEIGGVLWCQLRLEEAITAYQRAAELKPHWSVPWHNQAVLAFRRGDRASAIALLKKSAEIGLPPGLSRLELGMQLLKDGNFHEGWSEYEWRWRSGGTPPQRPDLVVPVWDGSPLGDRTLVLWHEQGYGDILQFVRFVSLIPKERGRILLHAQKRLASLLATCPGIDQIVVDGDDVDVDVQFPLMSLPWLFDIVPAPEKPYLDAPAECPEAQEAIQTGTAFNVGIVWASGRLYPGHAQRDCPLELFARLAEIPGVRLFSLQYGENASDLAHCPAPIVDLSPVLGDFYQTAAFVKRLDLIVTVDTSMPHLAGALGAPVWTLIARDSDWRWRIEGDSCDWYPTMRLYRQEQRWEWEPVMERVERDLRALVAKHFPVAPPPLPKRVTAPKAPVPDARIFIKQYGERRTGTNYVRASILANYADTELLMHVLGDKHSSPAPLEELRREAELRDDPAWSFVSTATFGRPALSTTLGNRDQMTEVRRLAVPVTGAFDRGELRYAVSIKEPYGWAVSIARMDRWIFGNMPLPDQFAHALVAACKRYNRVYSSWIALAEAHPDRTCFIRYEDLVRDSDAVFRAVEEHFGLQRRAPHWQDFGEDIQPTQWDGWGVSKSERLFDRRYYIERRYLERIPPLHRRIIADTIDWPMVSRFDYEPLER